MADKLDKLEQILKMLDGSVTQEDFVNSFENVVKLVIKTEEGLVKRTDKYLKDLSDRFDSLKGKLESSSQEDFAGLKKELMSVFSKALKEQENGMNFIRDKVKSLKLLKDGKDGSDGQDGKDGSPDTPKQVRDKLENLAGNERLDASAIKGLKEEMDSLKKAWSDGRPIFGPGKTKIILLDLSSQLDGVTKTFTIGTHFGIVGVWGSSAPFAFRPTVDYQAVGRTIVFDTALDAASMLGSGQTLVVQHLR